MNRYSLSDYVVSITPDDPAMRTAFDTISIGGQGQYVGSIRVRVANELWSTEGYATGAWIHNKNLDRHGTCEIEISQLANEVFKFIRLCNIYYEEQYGGCTITIADRNGRTVATCIDCYISKPADQEFREQAQNQAWAFTCGEITFG